MLIFSDKRRSIEMSPMRILIFQFTLILTAAAVISSLIHGHWVNYIEIYHTSLELICVFIAFSVFACIWYIYERSSASNYILGFGFFVVGALDALHSLFFLKLNLTPDSYFDLSTRYWIVGRLAQAITLYLAVKEVKIHGSKWIKLIFTVIITYSISYSVIKYHDYLPMLLTAEGVTPIKVVLEYIIIGMYSYTLYKGIEKLRDKSLIEYKHIFIALLLSISSEICFTLYSSVRSEIWTLGHILKILSYFFIFKAIFINSITYPYKRLEDQRDKLELSNRELRETTETLNDILDAMPIGVQTYNINGQLKYVNKRCEELLHCKKGDIHRLASKELSRKYLDGIKNSRSILFEASEDDGRQINSIRTYNKANGETITLSVKKQKIRNGTLILFNDANEEQKFDNLHIQTETILNAVSNGILMIDSNRDIVLCNKAIEEIFDMEREQIVGENIDALNEFIQFDIKELPDIVLSGEESKKYYESSLVTPLGVRKELMMYIAPIKNLYGEIIGGISVSTDVTELNNRQKKIMQQEKLALLGQMGAAIVHETRNYLTTIKGRCQLIELYTSDERVKEHAAKINDEIEGVNRIISEFLFLSKPRETELIEISMYDIFESIKSMVTTGSLVNGVDVEIDLCKEERYLFCDESQIKQVILNLCKNAVEAMSEVKNPKLRIETGFDEYENEMYIKVIDNGKGMTEEDLKKVGTPFFTTKESGTGLGISVCHNIMKEHNGRLEIYSSLGEGSTFVVVMPCIEDEDLDEVI